MGGPVSHEGEPVKCTEEEYLRDYKCPEAGWEWVYETCVYFSTGSERQSWADARTACQAKGAGSDLAIVPNADFVRDLLDLSVVPANLNHWIGLKSTSPGNFTWINGSRETTWSSALGDACIGQTRGGWRPENCREIRQFICQRTADLSQFESTPSLVLGDEPPLLLHEPINVLCVGDVLLDRELCLMWLWGNQTGQEFSRAACGRTRIRSHLVASLLTLDVYRKTTPSADCVRSSGLQARIFLEYFDIFNSMTFKCCREAYNDSWAGYRGEKCSPEKQIVVEDQILKPTLLTSTVESGSVDVFVGQHGECFCYGTTYRDGVMTVGWADHNNKLTWAMVFNKDQVREKYGLEPPGLLPEPSVIYSGRVLFVTHVITYSWSYNLGHFVSWMRNVSGLVNTFLDPLDETATWSARINVHYSPGKPALSRVRKDGLSLTAHCRSAVGNFSNSCLMWGVYLSESYIEVLFITHQLEIVKSTSPASIFALTEADVFQDNVTAGPIIDSTVDIRLPKFFKTGRLFCNSFNATRKYFFRKLYDVHDFHAHLKISFHAGHHDSRANVLVLVQLLVMLVISTLLLAGLIRWKHTIQTNTLEEAQTNFVLNPEMPSEEKPPPNTESPVKSKTEEQIHLEDLKSKNKNSLEEAQTNLIPNPDPSTGDNPSPDTDYDAKAKTEEPVDLEKDQIVDTE